MDYNKESLKLHYEWKGKIEVIATVPVENKQDLSLAYTPGVAEPCLEIQKDISKSYELTRRWNMVAVITDGTAVLGLGDIGPEAGMPVMEGKCVLFKAFGDVDAFPLCVQSKDVDSIVETVCQISGSFGGINLEDISAPRCFEIEQKLKERCDIPIFHDDQHGTAVVTAAAMINAMKLTGRKLEDQEAVVSGAGAAGVAVTKLLMSMGLRNVLLCDSKGAIYEGRDGLNPFKQQMAKISNAEMKKGNLEDVIKGADVFIGVSAPGILSKQMVESMNSDPIIFAMSNPVPEIMPELAKQAGASVIGTGRSDFANQINNVLAFPGIFRGALDVRASDINDEMKIAAAYAIASLIVDDELKAEYVIPAPFDPRVGKAVAKAVAKAAKESGVAKDIREDMDIDLGFGKHSMSVTIPDGNMRAILLPNEVKTELKDREEAARALNEPIGSRRLRDIVKKGEKVCIITSDITRPMPSKLVLPLILKELQQAGAESADITIVFALGNHRPHTEQEKRQLVGDTVYETVRCVDSDQQRIVHLGTTSFGTPVDVFEEAANADRIICLGNIEYHYFAGYSGGAKAVMPGVSTAAAIQANHSKMVEESSAAGRIDGNNVRADIDEVADFIKIDFILNVVLDEKKRIIKAVAGDHIKAHRQGCAFLRYALQGEDKATCGYRSCVGRRLSQRYQPVSGAKGA